MSNKLADLVGVNLGANICSYDESKVILYALAVGAQASELGLVYERDVSVLPTFGCALGLWAVELAGRQGAYDPKLSLHVAQKISIHQKLPASAQIAMKGRIANVYDKGKAALVEIEATSDFFTATYTVFLPNMGGWGGDRGSSQAVSHAVANAKISNFDTTPNLAALYRLTGDLHPVHIDPILAEKSGFSRPILHGLCTLGITAREIAKHHELNPTELKYLEARLTSPVFPGDTLNIESKIAEKNIAFKTSVNGNGVIGNGFASF